MSPSNFDIFCFVLKYALTSFGGLVAVLPNMERELASLGWLNHADFASTYALVQVLPGPNSVFCMLLGQKIGGLGGLLAAGSAVLLPPVILMGCLWQLVAKSQDRRLVRDLSSGLKFVVMALMLTSAWHYMLLQTVDGAGTSKAKAASLGLAAICGGLSFGGLVNKTLLIGFGAVVWGVFA